MPCNFLGELDCESSLGSEYVSRLIEFQQRCLEQLQQ